MKKKISQIYFKSLFIMLLGLAISALIITASLDGDSQIESKVDRRIINSLQTQDEVRVFVSIRSVSPNWRAPKYDRGIFLN